MNVFGVTDKGLVREDNQDCFRITEMENGLTVAILCDGMGGANAGALAADTACRSFRANLALAISHHDDPGNEILLADAASYANLRVYDLSRSSPDYEGMGTTLVAVAVADGECSVVNIGDSRAYHLHGDTLTRITEDHSLVEEMFKRGLLTEEEARRHPKKNVITRAVGLSYRIKSDTFHVSLREGDAILLCSDGLSNVVGHAELARILLGTQNAEEACRTLLAAAMEDGAPDNVTAVVIYC